MVIELIETSDSGSQASRVKWELVVLTPGKTNAYKAYQRKRYRYPRCVRPCAAQVRRHTSGQTWSEEIPCRYRAEN
jgi:hypothetical protein